MFQTSALCEEAWHGGGFTQKLKVFIGCIEEDCRAPAPPAAPLPALPQANPQTKATILVCFAQLRAPLLARGRA
jgi:hypothetical protein